MLPPAPSTVLQWGTWREPKASLPDFHDVAIRAVDLIIAALAIAFLFPLLIAVYVCVRASDGGPGIFHQHRIGKDGQTFRCLKFRSMVVDANERLAELLRTDPEALAEWRRDQKLRKDPRITLFGHFLRKSSIDELPQLWNVLRGEMSIIGPRPIVAEEVERYGRYFVEYVKVKPGLSGLWQVSGRNDVSYRRRVALDVAYVRNRSIQLNLSIMVRTVPVVLLSRGCR